MLFIVTWSCLTSWINVRCSQQQKQNNLYWRRKRKIELLHAHFLTVFSFCQIICTFQITENFQMLEFPLEFQFNWCYCHCKSKSKNLTCHFVCEKINRPVVIMNKTDKYILKIIITFLWIRFWLFAMYVKIMQTCLAHNIIYLLFQYFCLWKSLRPLSCFPNENDQALLIVRIFLLLLLHCIAFW